MGARDGGIAPLVKLLTGGSPEVQEQAAGAISDLAKSAGNRRIIFEEGGIPPLIALLSASMESAHVRAAQALLTLALDPSNQAAIAESRAIFVRTVDPKTKGPTSGRAIG